MMASSERHEDQTKGHTRADSESSAELTGTPGQVQLAASEDEPDPGSEYDAAIVEAFTETLARIAHSVASRKPDQGDQEE